MTRVFLCAVLAVAVGFGVAAETVTVRSGEHETYTRLVLKLPQKANWEISRKLDQATLEISLKNLVFDTSRVFDRIPKTRLNNIFQPISESALVLQLNCKCNVVGFVESETLLVVDITDSPSPAVQERVSTLLPSNLLRYRTNLSPEKTSTGELGQVTLPTITTTRADIEFASVALPETKEGRTRNIGMNVSEQRLLEQIGRASEQNLLTPLVADRPVASGSDITSVSFEERRAEGAGHVGVAVSAVTVVDRDMSRVSRELSHLNSEQKCLPAQLVALSTWGDSRSFSEQISDIRSSLFGEFDKINSETVLKLARTYLFFGFGAEAKAILKLSSETNSDQSVLFDMAAVLDDHSGSQVTSFKQQLGCDGDVSLWAVLAEPNIATSADISVVQQAFARLPKHLRIQLGPRLSRIYSLAGQTEAASSFLRAIDRIEDGAGPEHGLANAILLQSQGQPEAAIEKMESVVKTNSAVAPTAIVELTDLHLEEGNTLSSEFPELVGAYAQEYRSEESGADLRRAHSISSALADQFDASFATIREIETVDGKSEASSAIVPVLALLIENADDVTFLKHGLWIARTPANGLPEEMKADYARRLIDLGFPQAAIDVANMDGARPTSPELRLLKAEAAIDLGQPHRALVELLSLPGPAAGHLRALAMQQNGDDLLAGEAFLHAQLDGAATRSFWLADSADNAPPGDENEYSTIVKISEKLLLEPAQQTDLAPMSSARALLLNSESTRGGIDDLLARLGTESPIAIPEK